MEPSRVKIIAIKSFRFCFFTATLVILISLVGCSGGDDSPEKNTGNEKEEISEPDSTKNGKLDTAEVDTGEIDIEEEQDEQSTTTSPEGPMLWRQARAGMTTQQVLSAFDGEAVALEEPEVYTLEGDTALATASIDQVEVGGVTYDVHFLVDPKQRRLIRVALKPSSDKPEIQRNAFDELKTLLLERYGKPFVEESNSASKLLGWKDDERTIELKFNGMGSFASTYVWYKSSTRDGMDML